MNNEQWLRDFQAAHAEVQEHHRERRRQLDAQITERLNEITARADAAEKRRARTNKITRRSL